MLSSFSNCFVHCVEAELICNVNVMEVDFLEEDLETERDLVLIGVMGDYNVFELQVCCYQLWFFVE